MSVATSDGMILIGGVAGADVGSVQAMVSGTTRKAVASKVFCHPSLWKAEASLCELSQLPEGSLVPGFLGWAVPNEADLETLGISRRVFEEIAEEASDLKDFKRRVIASWPVAWGWSDFVDCSRENVYALDAFLESNQHNRAILVTIDPFGAHGLLSSGMLPELVAAAWVFDTSIAYSLWRKYGRSGRLLLLDQRTLFRMADQARATIDDFVRGEFTVSGAIFRFSNGAVSLDGKALSVYGLTADSRELSKFVTPALCPRSERMIRKLFSSGAAVAASLPALTSVLVESNRALSLYEIFLLDKARLPNPRGITLFAGAAALGKFSSRLIGASANYLVTALVLVFDRAAKILLGLDEWLETGTNQRLVGKATGLFRRGEHLLSRCRTVIPGVIRFFRDALRNKIDYWTSRLRSKCETRLGSYTRIKLPESRYSVVGVVAFDSRQSVVRLTISGIFRDLSNSEEVPAVVVACSSKEDLLFAQRLRAEHGSIGIVRTSNTPLGEKWQRAVDCAALVDPGYMFITGSDDLLSPRYLHRNLQLMRDHSLGRIDLAGPRVWYVVAPGEGADSSDATLWRVCYLSEYHQMPLGAGRIYSGEFLSGVCWTLFNQSRNETLDDLGYSLVCKGGGTIYTPTLDDGFVLSIKGSWDSLNPWEKLVLAEGVCCVEVDDTERESVVAELGESWKDINALLKG